MVYIPRAAAGLPRKKATILRHKFVWNLCRSILVALLDGNYPLRFVLLSLCCHDNRLNAVIWRRQVTFFAIMPNVMRFAQHFSLRIVQSNA